MKRIRNTLLMVALMCSLTTFGQFFPISFNVQPNQCYNDTSLNANGYYIDSVQVINPPLNGTLSDTPAPFTYCPDSGFIGSDTALVYGCVYSGGSLLGCGNFQLVFNVQYACSLYVSLQQDTAICVGGNRHFVAFVTGGTGSYTYSWSDGSNGNGACETAPGQSICVTVTDANNCSATTCSSGNGCNMLVFVSDSSPCMGPLPGLTATIFGGTAPYNYTWYDALTQNILLSGTGTPISPLCNLTPGTYCIFITDANGCNAYQCYTLNGVGGCYFTYGTDPLNTLQVYFSAGYDSAFSVSTYWWDFGDGTVDLSANPVHTYTAGGYYLVTMTLHYSNNDSCSYSSYLFIDDSINIGCQAYFYKYIDSTDINTFHFLDYSAYSPTSWYWDFGDGATSTVQNPTHTYSTQGTWNVCLTTTDINGCSSSYCEQISNVPVQDLEAYLFHATTIAPGFPGWVYLSYFNAGTILMNGTIAYRYPAGTTVNATSETPVSHDVANRLITFSYNSLLPGTTGYITVDLQASSSLVLGTLVYDTLWVNPINGDVTPLNNVSAITDSVVGSWDPNDKAVSPKGKGETGDIPLGTDELSYLIRFQNTGSATAQKVVIRDEISNNLDLTSVKVTDASHEHTTQLIGNELVVTFDHINLPDSGSNYTASQGNITVRAKLKPGLTNGTQIFNTAQIFFDFNSPVITNTVVNTLRNDASGISSISDFDFELLPNPASTQLSIAGEFKHNASFEIMNSLGEVVRQSKLNGKYNTIDISNLASGVYLVKIKSGAESATRKLIVTK